MRNLFLFSLLFVILSTTGVSAWAVTPALVIDAGFDDMIDEGDIFSATGSFTDTDDDTWTATVDYGDGNGPQILTLNPDKTFSLNHEYLQDNDFTFGTFDPMDSEDPADFVPGEPYDVTVIIDDGTSTSSQTIFVTVDNILPLISPIPDDSSIEGDLFSISGSFTDPGDDIWAGAIDYGDGIFEELILNPDNTFDIEHTFVTSGIYTVSVTIFDGDVLTESVEEFQVTVSNVSPILNPGVGSAIFEGDLFSTFGSFADPGDDNWIITVDYDDGFVDTIAFESDKTFSLEHVFTNPGIFEVSVTIDDENLPTVTEKFFVTVTNVSPTANAGPDAILDEGDTFVSLGSFADPGSVTPTITVDYDDGTIENLIPNPDGTFELSHVYTDDGLFTVSVSVDDGNTIPIPIDDASVTVTNILPDVSISDKSVDENKSFTASGSFADPGDDTWTASVDYGDGFTPQSLTLNPDKSFSLNNNYASNGAYTVTVTVNDGDGDGILSFPVGVFVIAENTSEFTSPASVTITENHGATFTTIDQDIWSLTEGSSSWELFEPQSWDESDSASDYVTLAKKKLGGGISAGTSGHLSMTASADELEGTINVYYPGDVEIQHLDINSFLAGENVPISTQWTLDEDGVDIDSSSQGDLTLFFDMGLKAFIDTDVCLLVGCEDLFLIPDVDFDTGETVLFSFDAAEATQVIPDFLSNALIGTTANFAPISVEPSDITVNPTTGQVVAEGSNIFSDMVLDIDKIDSNLNCVAAGIPPLPKICPSWGASIPIPGTTISYDLFDAKSNINFIANQKLTFNTGVLTKYDFSSPVSGVTGSIVDITTDGSDQITSVIASDGSQINVLFPQGQTDPITVTPTILLDSDKTTLHQFTELKTESDITMKSLEVLLHVPGFTVLPSIPIYDPIPHFKNWECHGFLCVNGHYHHSWHYHKIGDTPTVKFNGKFITLPAVWTSGPQGEQVKTDVISDDKFSLDGFNTVELASFVLDPEVPPTAVFGGPYVVDEGSVISMDGSGSFDVDLPAQTLSYSWDLDDDGVFETDGIIVEFENTSDGPADHNVSLQVCDYLNCTVDSGIVRVTNVNPTVDAGDNQEAVIHDTVLLDPATFTDPGFDCVSCGTLEDFTSLVNWDDGSDVLPISEIPGSLGVLTEGTIDGSHIYRLPGDYTVTVAVTDDDLGTGSDNFTTTVLGAIDLKNRVIDTLVPFESDSKDVEKAIEKINKSLDAKLWIDAVNLDIKKGHKVFDEEKNAVEKLMKLIKHDDEKKKSISPELEAAAQFGIDNLVNADRVLAITAMLDATSIPVDNPKDQKKVDKENTKSSEEFVKGDEERDDGDFDKAIKHYEKAWKHAQKAIKHAQGHDDDDDEDEED